MVDPIRNGHMLLLKNQCRKVNNYCKQINRGTSAELSCYKHAAASQSVAYSKCHSDVVPSCRNDSVHYCETISLSFPIIFLVVVGQNIFLFLPRTSAHVNVRGWSQGYKTAR